MNYKLTSDRTRSNSASHSSAVNRCWNSMAPLFELRRSSASETMFSPTPICDGKAEMTKDKTSFCNAFVCF